MSFAEDLSFGREGEVIVRNLLESSGNFDYVIDCSNDKYFQEKDIDLLALATDGHIAKYEVKTDRMGDNAEGYLLRINQLLRDGQIKRIRTYE